MDISDRSRDTELLEREKEKDCLVEREGLKGGERVGRWRLISTSRNMTWQCFIRLIEGKHY